MSIRQLDHVEKVAWVDMAHGYANKISKAKKTDLLEEAERLQCQMELAELQLMVVDRRLRQLGANPWLNPLPKRKAVEAMALAFPRFKQKICGKFS
jgi:hypothetical protein